jgi:hypothetical protein
VSAVPVVEPGPVVTMRRAWSAAFVMVQRQV